MRRHFHLQVSSDWAIGCDGIQWILLRRKMRGDQTYWQGVSFVRSTKRVLLRVLAEKGVLPTSEAQSAIDSWPERFKDWHEQNGGREE